MWGVFSIRSLVVCIVATGLASAESQSSRRYEQKISGGSNDPVYLGYDEDDSYKSNRQGAVALPGYALGGALAFLMVVFGIAQILVARGCCTKGITGYWCCTSNPRGYSKRTRLMLVTIISLCTGCLIAAAIVCMGVGVKNISDGTNQMMDILADECDVMSTTVNDLITTMDALDQKPHSTTMIDAANRVCDAIGKTKSDIETSNNDSNTIGISIWAVFCIVPLFGIASWLSGVGSLAVVHLVGSWLLMCAAFFLFGTSYSATAWVDDTCVQWQNWYDCKSPAYAFWAQQGTEEQAICTSEQLTLASSGALSDDQDLCPSFEALHNNGTSAAYWAVIYVQEWERLRETVLSYKTNKQDVDGYGPTFGINFTIPGEPPVDECRAAFYGDPLGTKPVSIPKFKYTCNCSDPGPGTDPNATSGALSPPTQPPLSSCVYGTLSNASLYNNITALRKIMYDTEGGHYDSEIKACNTLFNTSTASACEGDHCDSTASSDYSFADFSVKEPSSYDNSCIDSGWCTLNASNALFSKPMDQLSLHCQEKAILTAADAMWQASWMADCSYVFNAADQILVTGGACDTAGDGFVYIFFSFAFAGIIYLIQVIACYTAIHAFDSSNYEENIHNNDKLGTGSSAIVSGHDSCGDDKTENKVALEVEMKNYEVDQDDELAKDLADVPGEPVAAAPVEDAI